MSRIVKVVTPSKDRYIRGKLKVRSSITMPNLSPLYTSVELALKPTYYRDNWQVIGRFYIEPWEDHNWSKRAKS